MVSDVNQNPELPSRTENQPAQISPQPTVPNENGAGIFRVGLTKLQAQQEGLSSLFTKYNKDGNDEISQAEFDTYSSETTEPKQEDITSKSGKRTAVGGIYTIQAGDSLSKIAKDFGIPLMELYNANADVIGKSVNSTIHPGQQLKIATVQNKPEAEKSSSPNQTGTTTESPDVSAQKEKRAKMAAIMKAFMPNVDVNDQRAMLLKLKGLPKEQKRMMADELVKIYVDFDKIDRSLMDKSMDEVAEKLGISRESWDEANWADKGTLLAQAMNKHYQADLDETNENSKLNQAIKRLKTEGPTDRERELYAKSFDFNNLSDDDYKKLAQLSVTQGYVSTSLAIAHQKIKNGEEESFSIIARSYMDALFKDNDTTNFLMFMGQQHQLSPEFFEKLSNDYAKTYVSDENTDKTMQACALSAVAENADSEHLAILYQNNADIVNELNEVLQTVADTTTDESRRTMLNGIVANSDTIIQGGGISGAPAAQGSPSGRGSSPSVSDGLGMSNPIIQNANQINYVNELRQASQAFHANAAPSSSIPEAYRSAFTTMQEYRDFKGTGMTMAEYQRARSALKNNFTSVMNMMIENYSKIPDKFKPRILAFFDSMDNKTGGELYLSANDKVRAFMDKYNYMTSQKLLQYVQIHPAEVNEAPRTVQQMIRDLQEEQVRTE